MNEERSGGRNRAARIGGIILLAVVVIYLLFTQVFPRVEGYLEDPTLGAPPTAAHETTLPDGAA